MCKIFKKCLCMYKMLRISAETYVKNGVYNIIDKNKKLWLRNACIYKKLWLGNVYI